MVTGSDLNLSILLISWQFASWQAIIFSIEENDSRCEVSLNILSKKKKYH